MPRGESKLWQRTIEFDEVRKLQLVMVEDPTLEFGGSDAWCSWCVWPAAKVMIRYLSTFADDHFQRQSVLELGSGCGAVGMYMSQRGALPVVLTDVQKALPLLKRNVLANRLSCEVCPLTWGTAVSRLPGPVRDRAPFDLVLATDCTYDFVAPDRPSPTIDALLMTIQMLGRKALVCASRRPNEIENFEASLTRAGLKPNIVYSGKLENPHKEGVEECLVYEFVFGSGQEPQTRDQEKEEATLPEAASSHAS
mmetsp:Transcript_41973/g.90662  ORF Transcript_41973/g.90662 Transcript_41973/m.90662 type:complete len:252 (+) Transcript_41973:59-814(+)